jgi:hypothetical protein
VTGREPDDLGGGKREPGAVRGCSVVRVRPMSGSSGAGSAAGCSHPFACPRPGPGPHGAGPRQRAVRRGQSRGRPRRRAAAGQTTRRPRAWPLAGGKLFMRPAPPGSRPGARESWTGSGSGRPAGRRRPVGFQNSATGLDLGVYAAGSYSLIRPPRTARRLIRSWEGSAAGWSGRGGRRWRLRWGRRPL